MTLEQNITSNEVGIDHSQVKVIGAALNAAAAGSTVSFNIGKPHKDAVVDAMRYKNTIQVDFSLSGAVPELKVPVRITVPIPEIQNSSMCSTIPMTERMKISGRWRSTGRPARLPSQ